MTATAAPMPQESSRDAAPRRRDWREKRGLPARIDRRTGPGRRVSALVRVYTDALGGADAISPAIAVRIETAAETRVIAELARADYIAGRDISLDDVVRAERLAASAERALGIDHRRRDEEPDELDRLLAEKRAERDKADTA